MGNNSLSPAAAEPLSRLLLNKPQLTELNCYMNQLGDAGMGVLAPALGGCRWVQRRGEGWTSINDGALRVQPQQGMEA
jgi:hypothetical protein